MKKIILFLGIILLQSLSEKLFCNALEHNRLWSSAFSAGYVFKHDCEFKNVYGRGIVNIITADGCYYPWELWGIGAKVSYWRAKGRTTFFKERSLLQEVPITFYLKRIKDFECGLHIYGSLGGGIIWIKEKSYLGRARFNKGIGEIEVGLHYPIFRFINVMGAFRYIFPPQSQFCKKVDVGGLDVRAGISFSF